MRQSPCIELRASPAARLAYLLRDYAYLGHDPDALAQQLGRLKDLQGKETVQRWQAWARSGQLALLYAELMALHYDPLYERSQAKHFAQWAQRQVLAVDDLGPPALEQVAAAVRRLGG
jgi:tRNA 2-selenouridine synthase